MKSGLKWPFGFREIYIFKVNKKSVTLDQGHIMTLTLSNYIFL